MRPPLTWLSVISGFGLLSACGNQPTTAPAATPSVPASIPAVAPAGGQLIRVGGDLQAAINANSGIYISGPCKIDTPLPAGYPAPTPPGAIDIKSYPQVRRAEVSGSGSPDRGMNSAFWPLFNHIQSKKISMTSPVEMDYRGMTGGEKPTAQEWSMAFLYRTPDMNQTGQDGQVLVHDAAPLTVLSIGMRGDYGMSLVRQGMKELQAWLATHPEWQPAGDWRSLYYNGPAFQYWNKWAEVQIPILPAASKP